MKILNYDVKDKQSDYKQKVPFMPDRCFRMLVCGPSGSGKTNILLDMIYGLLYFDKIYLYAKNLQQSKYQHLIDLLESISEEADYLIIEALHLHLSLWGATDIATLSPHLILFSASLRALQNFNPVHSEILFSQRFFCRPLLALFLVKLSWQALMILIHAQTTLTCVSLLWLRYHHRAQWLA